MPGVQHGPGVNQQAAPPNILPDTTDVGARPHRIGDGDKCPIADRVFLLHDSIATGWARGASHDAKCGSGRVFGYLIAGPQMGCDRQTGIRLCYIDTSQTIAVYRGVVEVRHRHWRLHRT